VRACTPPPSSARDNFTLMMESYCCYSVYSVVRTQPAARGSEKRPTAAAAGGGGDNNNSDDDEIMVYEQPDDVTPVRLNQSRRHVPRDGGSPRNDARSPVRPGSRARSPYPPAEGRRDGVESSG
jgi:hypothetical protein